jgi:hypothetical protein
VPDIARGVYAQGEDRAGGDASLERNVTARIPPGVRFAAVWAGAAFCAAIVTGEGAYSLDASLPAYRLVESLSGHLKSVGSDTLGRETEAWATPTRYENRTWLNRASPPGREN